MPNPTWQDLLTDALRSDSTARSRQSVGINFDEWMRRIIMEAAEKRGLSMAVFLRRAGMAVAVHDLGLNWLEVMDAEPMITDFGQMPNRQITKHHGLDYGPWKITGMEEYPHG